MKSTVNCSQNPEYLFNLLVALMEKPIAALLKTKPRPPISDIKQQLRTSQRNLQIPDRKTKSSKSSGIEKNPH
jgi:hypothetical protein